MSDNIAWFDLDGSLFDYDDHLIKSLRQIPSLRNIDLNSASLWDLEKKYPILKQHADRIKSQPGWWRSMPPLLDGHAVFQYAKEIGFDCRILTKGPKSKPLAWMEKLQCCQDHFGENINVSIVSDKSTTYGKVLYDDYPDYMDAWLKYRPRGLGIMPENKANKYYSHPQVVKYDGKNLEEIRTLLQAALERKSGEPLSK